MTPCLSNLKTVKFRIRYIFICISKFNNMAKKKKCRHLQNLHFRSYFRVLRVDENVHEIVAKGKNRKNNVDMKEMVLDHIRFGSQPYYSSPLISLTAELNVGTWPMSSLHRWIQIVNKQLIFFQKM